MKNKTKQMIELTPEQILQSIGRKFIVDRDGHAHKFANEGKDSHRIESALDTLNIKWGIYNCLGYNMFKFEFAIEDIKVDCPILYKELIEQYSELLKIV
jgi:hypothetical protein